MDMIVIAGDVYNATHIAAIVYLVDEHAFEVHLQSGKTLLYEFDTEEVARTEMKMAVKGWAGVPRGAQ